jgi:hypothetical protein
MRSQVQVLAGPPPHHRRSQRCRQRAGNARCQLGPRWGRTPPHRHAPWPSPRLSTPASGSTTTTHRGRPPNPRRQPRGRGGHPALQPAPVPSRRRPATGAPPAGLARLVAQRSRVAALAHPARVRHRSPDDQRATRQHRPRQGPRPSTEPLDGAAAHRDLDPVLWWRCPLPRPGPQRHA